MDYANLGFSKKKHPFAELFIVTIAMLGVPYVIYRMTAGVLREFTHYSQALIHAHGLFFAGVVGTVFAVILLLSGFYDLPFMTVLNRWKELGEDVSCGMWRSGLRAYLLSLWENGIHFWVYLALTALQVVLIFAGLRSYAQLIGF